MKKPVNRVVTIDDVPSISGTSYPAPFDSDCAGREEHRIGDALGLENFSVNIVRPAPGDWSLQRHWHSRQDEFLLVLEGELTLVIDSGERILAPGDMVGFPAENGDGHHLINRSNQEARYLEVGDRLPGDEASYSNIDMVRVNRAGKTYYAHKDGMPYSAAQNPK